jgi:hypothetical protein
LKKGNKIKGKTRDRNEKKSKGNEIYRKNNQFITDGIPILGDISFIVKWKEGRGSKQIQTKNMKKEKRNRILIDFMCSKAENILSTSPIFPNPLIIK